MVVILMGKMYVSCFKLVLLRIWVT